MNRRLSPIPGLENRETWGTLRDFRPRRRTYRKIRLWKLLRYPPKGKSPYRDRSGTLSILKRAPSSRWKSAGWVNPAHHCGPISTCALTRPSPQGTAYLSPAFQRWVKGRSRPESRQGRHMGVLPDTAYDLVESRGQMCDAPSTFRCLLRGRNTLPSALSICRPSGTPPPFLQMTQD